MAKEKKQGDPTQEEYLEQALVPDWEQPYNVPGNWVWTRAGVISELNPPKQQPEDLEKKITFVPMAAVSEVSGSIERPEIRPAKSVIKGFTSFREGDVIFAKITPCMENGKVAIAENLENEFGYGSTEFFVFRPSKAINRKLLYYFLRNPAFRYEAKQNMSGAVGQQRVSKEFLRQHAFPLPPLAEQQRIVTRIENLFAKLDVAKEKAQAALDSFETRKAAILHKAFTGELTVKWRKEHGIEITSWTRKRFDEVAEIKSNLVDPAQYPSFPHIAPDNIEKRTGVLLDYHTITEDKVTSGKHRFYSGQILYSKIRPYLSKVVVVDFEGLCSADMYPITAKEDTLYLWYFMLSEDFLEQASSAGSRSVLPKINQKELSLLQVSMCSLPEQQEIVRILDDLFAKERQAKNACTDMLDRIDLIKRYILTRAFRGELRTNDPNEESAVGLLKQCLAQQANEQKQASKKEMTPTLAYIANEL